MRKISAYILIIIMMLPAFASCAKQTDGADTCGYAFAQKMADRDYEGAYDLMYSFTSDVQSKSDFVTRLTNIYDALQISDISLANALVTPVNEEEGKYNLEYTLNMTSTLLGDVSYTYNAEILSNPLGYSVIYTPSLILPKMEEGDKVRVLNQYGVRGEIFSADGKLLAQNAYAQTIYIDLDQNPDIEEVVAFLTAKYGVDEEKIRRKYANAVEKGYPLEVLATFPRDTFTAADISEITEVNGLGVDDERLSPIRYYPLADNAAHIIGYMGSPTEEQIEEAKLNGVKLNSSVGKTGLEAAYEDTLKGTDGRIIYIENSKGEIKEVLWEEAKSNGADIYLTIDTTLQNTAYTLLAANCAERQSGAVVIMDYKTGDVKAMVSYPSFDNNLFNFPISAEVWDYYSDPENQNPLFPRATQSVYMPGSSFKPFAAVPAIESGILTENSTPPISVEDNKWMPQMSGWHFPTINRTEEPKGGPWIFEVAMKSSDNIFFAYYTLEVGEEAFINYLKKIGIGEAPDFELPIKDSNLINDTTEEVSLHLLAEMGYGNGELEISPIQMASMYTAFENEGDMINPTIIDHIARSDDNVEVLLWENERTVFKEDTMLPSTIAFEKSGLRRVFTDGTAYWGNMWDIPGLYGKTGTGRMGNREVNWIIAINPNDGLLYLVVLDTGLDVGSAPKLAIMHGLLKPENYNYALKQDVSHISSEEEPTIENPGNDDSPAEGTGSANEPEEEPVPEDPPEPAEPAINPEGEEEPEE